MVQTIPELRELRKDREFRVSLGKLVQKRAGVDAHFTCRIPGFDPLRPQKITTKGN